MNSKNNFSIPFIFALLWPLTVSSAPILDQQVEGNTNVGLVLPGAQSFTVGMDGLLTSFEVELSGRREEERSYQVGLTRANADGSPVDDFESSYLFTQSGTLFDSQVSEWISFDLPNLSVSEGEQFFIYLVNTSAYGNFANTANIYPNETSDQYTDGALWVNDGAWRKFRDFGADISFRTYISEVPEPFSLLLVLTWLFLFPFARRFL